MSFNLRTTPNCPADDFQARANDCIVYGHHLISRLESDLAQALEGRAKDAEKIQKLTQTIAELKKEISKAFKLGMTKAAVIVSNRRFEGDKDLRSIAAAIDLERDKTPMNTTQTKHTPLPWDIRTNDSRFISTDTQTLAEAFPTTIHMDEARANAAFIVHACNNFYQLVEALELAQATIDRLHRHAPGSADGTLSVTRKALSLAKQTT